MMQLDTLSEDDAAGSEHEHEAVFPDPEWDSSSQEDIHQQQYQQDSFSDGDSQHEHDRDQGLDSYEDFLQGLRSVFGTEGNEEQAMGGSRAGTVAWYQERALEPIYHGSNLTVIQAAYLFLKLKHDNSFPDTGFDMIIRAFKETALPPDNLFPPSLHIMNGLAGVESMEKYTYHVCRCSKHVYPQINKVDWPRHYSDCCPKCGAPRFEERTVANRSVKEPSKVRIKPTYNYQRLTPHPLQWLIYFGLGDCLRSKLFSNPEFNELRTKGREENWYSSSDASNLNQKLQGLLFNDPNTSAYALGYDFAGLFNFKDHSTGLIFLRCEDLPAAVRTKRSYHLPLMIVPGPQQPEDLDCYFQVILDELKLYGPGGPGLVVSPAFKDGATVSCLPPRRHRVVLTGLYCDTPARCKAGQMMKSASAFLACNFCWLAGTKNIPEMPGNKATLFLGYEKPIQPGRGLLAGTVMQIGIDDEVRLLTDEQQRWRAELVETARTDDPEFDPGLYGCAGYSRFHRELPYLHYNNFFIVPFAHAVFLGVVKDFMKLALGFQGRQGMAGSCCMSYATLRAIKEREKDYILTSDFGRPLSSIVNKSGR